jgi:glutamate-1-semialdehyde 2,1-aminomutase
MRIGGLVQSGWVREAGRAGLKAHASGIAPMTHYHFEHEEAQAMMTFYVQEMLGKGFLASGRFYASYAHRDEHVNAYLEASRAIFEDMAQALREGDLMAKLRGPVAHAGFKRLT